MPTINQLVRKGRKTGTTKSTSPALQHGYNSMKKKLTDRRAPQKSIYSNKHICLG